MCIRRRGFSLVELSFVIVIMLILGGLVAAGGSYMTKEARVSNQIQFAKEMLNALRRFEAARAMGGFPYPKPADWNALYADLGKYMEKGDTVQSNPFDTSAGGFFTYPNPCAANVITCAGFSQASFPQTAGRLEYLYKNSPTPHSGAMWVWDGTQNRSFRYYAVQVTDSAGYPAFTDGR